MFKIIIGYSCVLFWSQIKSIHAHHPVTFQSGMKTSPDDQNDVDHQRLLNYIGLAIVIVSAIFSNLGVNVQKYSHIREEKRPRRSQRVYYVRPTWIIGMTLVILGSLGDFEALAFSPQALVASVGGGCTVLANVLFAHLWLGQSLSFTDLFGTLFIISGVVLSTIANEPDDELSLSQLEDQFLEPEFLIYIIVLSSLLIFIFGEINATTRLQDRSNGRAFRRLPYLFATAAGIFGSWSVLLAKCASMLLLMTIQGRNQFIYVTTYMFLGGMGFTMVLQTDLLNRAIMVGDTLTVFPVFQCFWIGCSVIGGVIYYRKYLDFSIYEWIALPLACILILVGIYLLSQHEEPRRAKVERTKESNRRTSFHLVPLSPASTITVDELRTLEEIEASANQIEDNGNDCEDFPVNSGEERSRYGTC